MKINWAFIDLDGTLLNSRKKIPIGNLDVLKEFSNNKGNIVIATGRWPVSALKLNNQIEAHSGIKNKYLIALNGANIYDLETQTLIYEKAINENIFSEILKYIKKLKIAAWIYTKNGIQNKQIFSIRIPIKKIIEKFNYGKIIELKKESISDDKVYKFLLFTFSKKRMDKIIEILNKNFVNDLSIIRHSNTSIEVTAENTSKGEAIKFLQKQKKFKWDNTIALGDSQNDLSMFKTCRYQISFNEKDRMLTSISSSIYKNQKSFPKAFTNWIINYDMNQFKTNLKIVLDLYGWFENINYKSIYKFKNLLNYIVAQNSLTISSCLPNWLMSNLFEPLLVSKNTKLINENSKKFNEVQVNEAKKFINKNQINFLIIQYENQETTLIINNINLLKQYNFNLNTFKTIKPFSEFDIEKEINTNIISISVNDLNVINHKPFKITKSYMYHIYSIEENSKNNNLKDTNIFKINEYKYIDKMLSIVDKFLEDKYKENLGENCAKRKK